jgi:hypothetical protein
MIRTMANQKGLHAGAVVIGVSVDQVGSFAMGAAIAILTGAAELGGTLRQSDLTIAQNLYEVLCIALGTIGACVGARVAGRSMVVHGLAISNASLAVSMAIGLAANQKMFDGRGILFQVLALMAGPLGGWLASQWPVPAQRRPEASG